MKSLAATAVTTVLAIFLIWAVNPNSNAIKSTAATTENVPSLFPKVRGQFMKLLTIVGMQPESQTERVRLDHPTHKNVERETHL